MFELDPGMLGCWVFASPRTRSCSCGQADLYGVACFICECMRKHDLITKADAHQPSWGCLV